MSTSKQWFDLLDEVCPNIDLVQTKAFLHDILNYIEVHHKELEKEYRNKRILDKLDEKFLIQDLPPSLKNFIEEYIFSQDTEIPKEVNLKKKKLLRATRNLLDR
ncbi:16851_t:CDS:2, partial [Cetraspora pellucida]